MKAKLTLILGYVASTLFALLLAFGLFILMMPLSDPNSIEGGIAEFFVVGGSSTLMGLLGAFLLRGVYRNHPRFFRWLGGATSILAIITGYSCLAVLSTSHSPLPFVVGGLVYGLVVATGGEICLARTTS